MGSATVKIVFLFNFLLMGLGIFLIYCGFSDQVIPDQLNNFAGFVDELSVATKILIIIGIVIFIMSFFGCWGAFTENTTFLKLYVLFLFVLIVLEGFVGFYVFYKQDTLKNKAENVFKDVLNRYDSDNNDKVFVDTVQSKWECCGVEGPSDWAKISKSIPSSCCKSQTEKCEKADFNDGCLPKLLDAITNGKTKLIWIIVGVVVFEIVVIWITFRARDAIRDSRRMVI